MFMNHNHKILATYDDVLAEYPQGIQHFDEILDEYTGQLLAWEVTPGTYIDIEDSGQLAKVTATTLEGVETDQGFFPWSVVYRPEIPF